MQGPTFKHDIYGTSHASAIVYTYRSSFKGGGDFPPLGATREVAVEDSL